MIKLSKRAVWALEQTYKEYEKMLVKTPKKFTCPLCKKFYELLWCRQCPTVILTRKECASNPLIHRAYKAHVDFCDGKPLTPEDRKAIQARMRQIKRWIKKYGGAR